MILERALRSTNVVLVAVVSFGSLPSLAQVCTQGPAPTPNGVYAACTNVPVGGACSLTCNSGYTKSGANPTCVGGTTWSGAPTCVPNSCAGPPPAVVNGTYASCPVVASGGTCALTCANGYVKSGADQVCNLGAWSGAAPTCAPSFCVGPPASTPNGLYGACTNVPVGGTCSLTCNPGYTQNGASPVCVGGTTYSGSPSCTPNSCSGQPPAVTNGTYASCPVVASGSTCALTCANGYVKSGADQVCNLGAEEGGADLRAELLRRPAGVDSERLVWRVHERARGRHVLTDVQSRLHAERRESGVRRGDDVQRLSELHAE